MHQTFSSPAASNASIKITRLWLILAIMALTAAGLFSLPPVLLRGSFFSSHLNLDHIFTTSLVLHVNLSVLVWMLAIYGTLSHFTFGIYRQGQHTAFFITLLGMAIIILSTFYPGTALKNNYIPVLVNFPFFLGLAFFTCGILLQTCLILVSPSHLDQDPLKSGMYICACIVVSTMLCFILSSILTPSPEHIGLYDFYESIFWGGGHSLQFVYTTTMIMAWLILARQDQKSTTSITKFFHMVFLINGLCVLPLPLLYIGAQEATELTTLFTQHMRYFSGIAPSLAGIGIILFFSRISPGKRFTLSSPLHTALLLSIGLFCYGGILGLLITGANVTIPAHYHGSIVAITISFMGLVYYLLPKLHCSKPHKNLACWQLYLYSIGQTMHITGLAWMGGYGVLRKTPGADGPTELTAAKMLFFTGGSLAILGGVLFSIISIVCIIKRCKTAKQ